MVESAVLYQQNSAFDHQKEYSYKNYLPLSGWREKVDQNLRFFTREYIIQEDITTYHYGIKRDQNHKPYQIYSPGYEHLGDVLNSFKRGIGDRSQAECHAFQQIEQNIFSDRYKNNFFVWISPPGKKEHGFKDHNFTFIGQVKEDRIDMVAYKNYLAKEDNLRFINKYLPENKRLDQSASDIDFLKAPVYLPSTNKFKTHLDIIRTLDPNRNLNPTSYEWMLDKLSSYRQQIINAIETNDFFEAEYAQNAHDNYALALTKNPNALDDFYYWADQEGVILEGSCGFGGGYTFDEEPIFGGGLTWFGMDAIRYFCKKCPNCNKEINTVVKPGDKCPKGCGAQRKCA